ncbi:MAG: MFS family permease [Candidatus Poriferisodalaceae bacterium]|jgi:MFS family permease
MSVSYHVADGDRSTAPLVVAMMAVTISSVYPGFLIGALSVQVSAEFDVSESVYGWGLGGFFLAATLGSVPLGRLAQHIGPRNQMSGLLLVGGLMQLLISTVASSFAAVVALLVVCGFVNAGTQTAVNLALGRAQLPRLGLAIALKQSGMPAASMISGFAVPALALTVGWRWGYVVAAAMSLVTAAVVFVVVEPWDASARPAVRLQPVSDRRTLRLTALGGGMMSFGAGSLNAWLVSSGVDAGLADGTAGLMLGLGAASGIALRLVSGALIDNMTQRPFRVGGATALIGAIAMGLLAVRSSNLHMVATIGGFAGGWIWPVFTNYGVIRANGAASGAATGTTQMGIYVGVFSAPLITGQIIEAAGYTAMWPVVACMVAIGAVITMSIADRF